MTTVSNLAYFGYQYQRVALDKDYSAEYSYKWNQMEVHHALMRPVFTAVGVAMFVSGLVQIGTGSATGAGIVSGAIAVVFGLDMMTGGFFGHVILDAALTAGLGGLLTVFGKDTSLMDEYFSFYHFTSNPFHNLLLTQLTFMVVGGVISLGTKHILSRIGRPTIHNIVAQQSLSISEEISKFLAKQTAHFFSGTVLLLSLQPIGSTMGLAAEYLLQGIILIQIMASTSKAVLEWFAVRQLSDADKSLYLDYRTRSQELYESYRCYGADWLGTLRDMWNNGGYLRAIATLQGITTLLKVGIVFAAANL